LKSKFRFCVKSGNSAFDPRPITKRLAFAVISKLFVNDNMRGDRKEFGDELLKNYDEMISKLVGAAPFQLRLKHIPILNSFYLRFKFVTEQVQNALFTLLREHEDNLDPQNPKDFLDVLILSRKEYSLDDVRIVTIMMDSLAAGSDTSSTTIEWMILYLAAHPQIQEKLHAELDAVIGRDYTPKYDDHERLPYFLAVIKETMRIRPVAFFALPHRCSETTHNSPPSR
jgi:cytochrome P450